MDWLVNTVYYVVPFIVLLGILVFVHEFGHFIVARLTGVQVEAFSIGFGKTLWSRKDAKGTTWKISAVPLGGYCQFLGDADASSSTADEKAEELSEEQKKVAFPYQNPFKNWQSCWPVREQIICLRLLFCGNLLFCRQNCFSAGGRRGF